jgi:hypothetical protein
MPLSVRRAITQFKASDIPPRPRFESYLRLQVIQGVCHRSGEAANYANIADPEGSSRFGRPANEISDLFDSQDREWRNEKRARKE